jgi:hypothetical protein
MAQYRYSAYCAGWLKAKIKSQEPNQPVPADQREALASLLAIIAHPPK